MQFHTAWDLDTANFHSQIFSTKMTERIVAPIQADSANWKKIMNEKTNKSYNTWHPLTPHVRTKYLARRKVQTSVYAMSCKDHKQ
jgi:hypothetical protein